MGAIKIDIKKDHEWNNVCLNSADIIAFLIQFRYRYDENYICKSFYNNDILKSNGIPDFSEEITCLYADLDIYIKNANLYKRERIIIKYLMIGITFEEIAEILYKKYKLKYNAGGVRNVFKRSCSKILNEYNYNYQIWLETSEKIKIEDKKKYKICSRCKKSLERNTKYFAKRKTTSDKLEYICRVCGHAYTYFYKQTLKQK